jgi:hypothetical protein
MRRSSLIFALMLSGQAFGQIAVLPKVQVPVATFADRFVLAGTATDNGWAMVWTERDGIYGALLDKEAKHFGNPVQIGTEPPNDRISVGWSGTRLLVAWIDGPNAISGTLRIRRVLNGEPEGDEQVIESNAASVKVAGSAYGALLVWTAGTEVHALRFNRDAARIDQVPVRVEANSASKGGVYAGAAAGESYFIAWGEADLNPNYPCRFDACAGALEVRMVACRLDPSGTTPTTTLRSHVPGQNHDSTGPYPQAFAWSPRSGLLLWDDNVQTLLIPVSEELFSRSPIIDYGFPNAQFDGRNFIVCISHTLHPGGGIFVIVSQFGDSSTVDDVVVPYAQLVAGRDGQVLLAWTSGEQQGTTTLAYAAVGIDYSTFPTGRHRAVRR